MSCNNENSLLYVAAIEINVTERCNLKCMGCDHAMGFIPERHIGLADIDKDLKGLKNVVHARTVRVIGGEPLLHPEFENIVKSIHRESVADYIELWTNGTLLHKMPAKAWEYINGIIISKYPERQYSWTPLTLGEYANRYDVWIHVRDCSQFTWSHQFRPVGGPDLIKILYANCREASICHTIRNGKFYKCVQSAFAHDRLKAGGVTIEDEGIPLHNNSQVRKEIELHLRSNVPLKACSYCFGEFGDTFVHQEMQSRSLGIYTQAAFDPNFILPESLR